MATFVGWAVGAVCSVLLVALAIVVFVEKLLGGDEAMEARGVERGSATEEGMQPG